MSDLYFSLRQRNVWILLTTTPPFLHPSPSFSLFPIPLVFSIFYFLMDSTFLRMLTVPSKTDFSKLPPLYDIPMFFKLHSKSFGMDPSVPIIIGTINVFLSHILIVVQSSYPVFCFFSESGYYQRDTQHQLSNIFFYSF